MRDRRHIESFPITYKVTLNKLMHCPSGDYMFFAGDEPRYYTKAVFAVGGGVSAKWFVYGTKHQVNERELCLLSTLPTSLDTGGVSVYNNIYRTEFGTDEHGRYCNVYRDKAIEDRIVRGQAA